MDCILMNIDVFRFNNQGLITINCGINFLYFFLHHELGTKASFIYVGYLTVFRRVNY